MCVCVGLPIVFVRQQVVSGQSMKVCVFALIIGMVI